MKSYTLRFVKRALKVTTALELRPFKIEGQFWICLPSKGSSALLFVGALPGKNVGLVEFLHAYFTFKRTGKGLPSDVLISLWEAKKYHHISTYKGRWWFLTGPLWLYLKHDALLQWTWSVNQTWPSIFLGYMLSCNPLLPFGCCLLLFGSEHKRMPEEARWPHINHILTKKLKDLTSWLLLSNPLQQRYYNVVWQNLKELGQHTAG